MNTIEQERCFNHRGREAAARCPECHRFFCRECVTEHGDRVVCAGCLRAMAALKDRRASRARAMILAAGCIAGFLTLWLVFHAVGRGLLRLPSSFHEGTLWRQT